MIFQRSLINLFQSTSNRFIQFTNHTLLPKFIQPSFALHSAQKPSYFLAAAMVNRRDLMNYVFENGSSPAKTNFQELCKTWIEKEFSSQVLLDGKSAEQWLAYFCKQSFDKWRKSGYRQKDFLKIDFFGIEIIPSEAVLEQPDQMEVDPQPELNLPVALTPIDLKNGDLTKFQFFVCPTTGCDFRTQERLAFMTHVVKDHPYVQGKIHKAAQDHGAA